MKPWTPFTGTNMTRADDSIKLKLAALLAAETAASDLALRLANPDSQESYDLLSAQQEAARIEEHDKTEPEFDPESI